MAKNERTVVPEVPVRSSTPNPNWRMQTYVIGGIAGVLFGLLGAYMYARAAEEDVRQTGAPASPQTGELIGLGLAALAMVRQIAELGRSEVSRKKK